MPWIAARTGLALTVSTLLLAGCAADVTEDRPAVTAAGSAAPAAPAPTRDDPAPPDDGLPDYGVVPTTTRALAPAEQTCPSPAGSTVRVSSSLPGSPTVIVGVPDGFGAVAPTGPEVRLAGPDGVTAVVTITAADPDPAAAFRRYTDQRTGPAARNTVSILPAELCDYSGQKLMGVLTDEPGSGIGYADRIVHVWTGSGTFLIAVAVQAPSGTPGFDAASAAMLGDFGVQMPD